ncbi:hypothetical protein ACFL6C_05480 [Myxococcota bacterium]
MGKRSKGEGDGLFQMLDYAIAVRRHLQRENVPAPRLKMTCGHLVTPLGKTPLITLTPFPAIVMPDVDAERSTFARFGKERPWAPAHRETLESLQGLVESPIVYLEQAYVEVGMRANECLVRVGTPGKPGWTNQNDLEMSTFEYLKSMSQVGGVLIDFAELFERRFEPRPSENERAITWMDIHISEVGRRALAMTKHPRDRLILLLAVHLHMSPTEISRLNLSQIRQKPGRDYRHRVYLKKRLVRRKTVADALVQFRKRDQDSCWQDEPMFRTAGTTRMGRSKRMGAKAIEALITRYVERAKKEMPPEPPPEDVALPSRPALFWVSKVVFWPLRDGVSRPASICCNEGHRLNPPVE